MPNPVVNKASTEWNGELFTGSGTTTLETSGKATFDVAWQSRGEQEGGTTTPEELIAAAHATCYAMQFSNMLKENGTPPTQLNTSAAVTFVAGTGITGIELTVRGTVEGIDAASFDELARKAKETCPVSQALAGTEITLADVQLA
ncbi:OsmC family peroxiredoxin [Georgenia satyanarayanai]|uniref:OsmC family peroxiredoxin n=1 Tax=Georgenia satyanarayanai TaxID=860221 RepID=UPI00203E8CBB|nr:OsmC family peroxiredoxin [Georgenia satyanarayanai]MCM3659541.1 OsmC family peroxiredoxin [Georgenia satyanarayanai]